jgi:cyclic pyranopterin monophosphate synthase
MIESPAVRFARAGARVFTTREVVDRIRDGRVANGSVLEAARIAGVQAARRTSELIPPGHPLLLDHMDVLCTLQKECVHIEANARTTAPTGVEMGAITAASVAALTIYDLCKALDPSMVLSRVRLLGRCGSPSGAQRV